MIIIMWNWIVVIGHFFSIISPWFVARLDGLISKTDTIIIQVQRQGLYLHRHRY